MAVHDFRRLNQRQPAVNLPADILLHIFKLHIPEDKTQQDFGRFWWSDDLEFHDHEDEAKTKPSFTELLTLTHVCHNWRVVALNALGLWALV